MKRPYKVMALSTLIATIAAGSITPAYASAAEHTTKSSPIYADSENKYPEYSLGPEGLKTAIQDTGSNMLVMDLYALTIIKQANINFDGVTSLKDDLKTSITQNIGVSRENANQWLDGLKPQIIQTNQNIINYNTKFQSYYDILIEAVNNKDKETLKEGLEGLTESIFENKDEVDKLVKDLIAFRGKLATDTQSLKNDTLQITNILTGEDAGIPLMQKQIEINQKLIDDNTKILIGSSVATSLGALYIFSPFFPLGVAGVAGGIYGATTSKEQINSSYEEIKRLTLNISSAKEQVAKLTILKNNTSNVTDTIDIAITALQNISNQWQTMGSKYKSLLGNVDNINPNRLAFIKADIATAKGSWNDVKEKAEMIQKSEISFVEDKK